MYDLCVIGGGMSGMTTAITAARAGKKVVIFDKNKKLGKKLYATGNGRCNLTNMNIDIGRDFNSSYVKYEEFLNKAFGDKLSSGEVIDFFNSIGVPTVHIDNTYVYPASMQASTVVWALIDALQRYGVDIVLDTEINEINYNKDSLDSVFEVCYDNKKVYSKKLVLANGSKAYMTLGGSSIGYALAKSFGHSIIPLRPALCGLVTEEDLSHISGVRAKAKAALFKDECDKPIATEVGEVQVTDYGLSGIMMFNLSSKVGTLLEAKEKPIVGVNFLACIEEQNNLSQINVSDNETLRNIYNTSKDRTVLGFLNSLVNDKLASYVCDLQGIDKKAKVSDLSEDEVNRLILGLGDFKVHIRGTKDFENGQVCAGGVDISEINPIDFSSKICSGLYIVGELLDIDGLCGGYNLTFAVLSGIAAGKAI